MKTRIKVFKNKNSEAMAEKINEDKLDFFASQIFQAKSGWVAFCYYKTPPKIEIKA